MMRSIILILCCGIASALLGAPTRLCVVNALSEDLSIIDVKAQKVIATIPLGARGYRVDYSPDGETAYVTSYPPIYATAGKKETPPQLIVVDLVKFRVEARIPLPIAPLANVHLSPDGDTAYLVTAAAPGSRNSERGRVLSVRLDAATVTDTIPIGLNVLDSAMLPDGSRMYTADWASRSVSVVNLNDARLTDTIPFGTQSPRTLALRPDGKRLYVALDRPVQTANDGPGQYQMQSGVNQAYNFITNGASVNSGVRSQTFSVLSEIDTKTQKVTRLPFDDLCPIYALAVNEDGSRVYLYGRKGFAAISLRDQKNSVPREIFDLISFNPVTRNVIKRYGDFGSLATMVLSPDGKRLYLVGTPGNAAQEGALHRNNVAIQQRIPKQSATVNGQELASLMDELARLRKTVTVVDVTSGKVLYRLTVGSLPQGATLID